VNLVTIRRGANRRLGTVVVITEFREHGLIHALDGVPAYLLVRCACFITGNFTT